MRHLSPPSTRPAGPREHRPAGFSLAAAFAGSFLAVAVATASSLPDRSGLVLVVFVVVLSSIDATWPAAVGDGVFGWLFFTGFVENRFGELQIDVPRDGWRLLLLVAVAVAVSGSTSRDNSGAAG